MALFNENYFNVLDTVEKYYFLGLIFSDGNVSSNNNGVVIGLQSEDKYILEYFAQKINHIRGIKTRKNINPSYKDKSTILCYSKHFHDRLIELGCPPAKSLILKWPTFLNKNINDKNTRAFILGFFDGNGGIFRDRSRKFRFLIGIASTKEFCEGLQEVINQLGCTSRLVQHSRFQNTHENTREFTIGGNLQVKMFLDWLYQDNLVSLKRKRDLYQLIVDYYNDPKNNRRPNKFDPNYVARLQSIRDRYLKEKTTYSFLAKEYNLDRSTIVKICTNTYKCIELN